MYFQKGRVIAERYKVVDYIDSGKFGQVLKCQDILQDNKLVAAKISKQSSLDVDIAKVEGKLIEKLQAKPIKDLKGYDCLVHMEEIFMFENRMIIIFECLGPNLHAHSLHTKKQKGAPRPLSSRQLQ